VGSRHGSLVVDAIPAGCTAASEVAILGPLGQPGPQRM